MPTPSPNNTKRHTDTAASPGWPVACLAGLIPALLSAPASAACSPTTAPASNQSVVCQGSTTNTAIAAGAGSQNVSITVEAGAVFSTNTLRALSVEDASTITNNGTITMAGGAGAQRGAMVGFGDGNTLINNGTINTAGAGIRGISVPNTGSTRTTVLNQGSILTTGTSSHGIALNGPGNTVTNTGSIDVSGTDAKGVFLQGGSPTENVLLNSASIHARGLNSTGFAGADGVHVNTTNANGFFARVENLAGGSIISDHSYALRGQNGNDSFFNAGYLEGHGGADGNTAVFMGPLGTGNLTLRTGSVIRGTADGGGAVSNAFLEGQGLVDNVFTNFRSLTMRGSDWRWTSDAAFSDSVNLQSGTFFLTGSLGSPTNTLAAGAVLAGTGTLTGALSNAGEIRPGPGDGLNFGALTVRGNYTGAGGTLTLNTVLGADNAPSDRLVIDGGQASGATPVTVNNRGGTGALTAADGILLVQAVNGGTTAANAFSLATPLTAGAYDYHLYRGGADGNNADNWYLRSRGYVVSGVVVGSTVEAAAIAASIAAQTGQTPRIDAVNLYRPEAALYSGVPTVARQLGLAQLGTFHERQGDQALLRGDGERRAGWARVFGSRFEKTMDGDAQPGFKGDLSGVQFGQDLYSRLDDHDARNRLGLFAGYAQARGDVRGAVAGVNDSPAGRLDMDSYSLGAYWTRAAASGAYLDAVVMNTWLKLDTASSAGRPAHTKGNTFSASLETGIPWVLSEHWRLEPQAQLIYQRSHVDDFQDAISNVSIPSDKAVTGRLGLRLNGDYASGGVLWRPYARLNVWRTFNGTNTVLLGNDGVNTPRGSTAAEVALGLTAQVNERFALYGALSHTRGVDGQRLRNTGAQVGARYAW